MGWRYAAILGCAVALGGCTRTYDFEDTEERKFHVECKSACDTGADFVPKNAKSTPACGAVPGAVASFSLHSNTRYLGICDAWIQRGDEGATAILNNRNCRALIYKQDSDCPPAPFIKKPTCMKGWCGNPEKALEHPDVQMLCLAGTGAWTKTPEQIRRNDALAATACKGSVCTVPKECRQP